MGGARRTERAARNALCVFSVRAACRFELSNYALRAVHAAVIVIEFFELIGRAGGFAHIRRWPALIFRACALNPTGGDTARGWICCH